MRFVVEIRRREHCRGNQTQGSWLLTGRSRVGTLTTEHSASSYGQPVALVPQWSGQPLNYSDIESIDLMMPGAMDDYRAIVEEGNPMEHKDFPRSITHQDVAAVSRSLAPFGITVGCYGGGANEP